jgi:hypothetical protein
MKRYIRFKIAKKCIRGGVPIVVENCYITVLNMYLQNFAGKRATHILYIKDPGCKYGHLELLSWRKLLQSF